MVLVLDERITAESLKKLAEAYNQSLPKGEFLDIYISTEGGEMPTAEAMVNMINRYQALTTLTAFREICSAGIDIFYKAECAKEIVEGTIGMIHSGRWNVNISDGGHVADEYDEFKKASMKKGAKDRIEFFKSLGFKEEEINRITVDKKDLWIDTARLEKMLKKRR